MRELAPEAARAILLRAAALDRDFPPGAAGILEVLDALDVIQLDPIDRVGQNADLVVGARVRGVARGDVHRVLRGRSFEHWAKERCIVHARHFEHYRGQAVQTPWWRNDERVAKVPAEVFAEVVAEVREKGPMPAENLTPRGRAVAMDWGGWKSTTKLEVLAAEALWTRCELVVSGRDVRGRRLYDVPERALGAGPPPGAEPFAERMLLARVASAGLLSRAGGPMWSMLSPARTDGTVERLLASGALVEVRVGRRPYLCLPALLALDVTVVATASRGRAVVLGPLDPLLWDRALVRDAFAFDYIWEIYKPESARRWGYYVCPVLVEGALVGRLEGRRDGGALRLEKRWGDIPEWAWNEAISRLAAQNGRAVLDVSIPMAD